MSQNPTIKQIQLAGTVYDLQVDSVNNCNPTATDTNKYDWIGTQAEYVAQDVATNHPNWVCFITDDISDQTGIIDLSNYVKKTGDEEISGDKTFTNHRIKIKSNTTYDQTPATREFTSVFFNDGTTNWGAAEAVQNADGSNCVQINVRGQNGSWTDCPLGIGVTSAGDTYTYAPTPSTVSNNNTIATTSYITTILSTLYPVGSLYLGTQSTCPLATLIPGSTWTQIQGRYLLASGTLPDTTETAVVGTYISAGLPNITGSVNVNGVYSGASDAFYSTSKGRTAHGWDGNGTEQSTYTLDASRSSSIYGQSATVRPAAYAINVWQRTA